MAPGAMASTLEPAAEHAYIEQIRLENFMCHRLFVLDLNPNMNIIIGKNGSGKSAILTALIIGLGGSSRATSRGNSMRELIRQNAQSAYITLTIYNPNQTSLRKYGRHITIIRRITHKASTWTIKNGNRVMSNRGADVERVVKLLGFLPDNVLAMLNQEQAKEFLVTATAKTKYDRFDKAFRFSSVFEFERLCNELLENQDLLVNERRGRMAGLDRNYRALVDKLECAQELSNFGENVALLRSIIEWRKVRSQRSLLDAKQRSVLRIERELGEARETDLDAERERLTLKRDGMAAEVEVAMDKQHEKEMQLGQLQTNIDGCRRGLQEVQTRFDSRQELISALEEEISKLEQRAAQQEIDPRPELEAAISTAERDVLAYTQELHAEQEMLDKVTSDREHAQVETREVKQQIDALKEDIQGDERRLQELSQFHRINPLDVFTGRMRQVFEEVQRVIDQQHWNKKPVGPLGKYVKVADPKYSAIAGSVLGSLFTTFWCEDPNDRRNLLRILRQKRVNAQVLLWRKELFNYRQVPQSDEYLRMEDLFVFQDIVPEENVAEAVKRLFIDHIGFESDVFCSDIESALRLSDPSTKPPYIHYCYVNDGAQGIRRHGSKITGMNDSIYIKFKGFRVRPAGSWSRESEREEIGVHIRDTQLRKRELDAVFASSQESLNELGRRHFQHSENLQKLREQIEQAERTQRERQAELENLDSGNRDNDDHAVREELPFVIAGKKKQLGMRKKELSRAQRDVEKEQKKIQDAEQAYADCQSEIRQCKSEAESCRKECQRINADLGKLERESQQGLRRITDLEQKLASAAAETESLEETLNDVTRTAEEVGPEPQDLGQYDSKTNSTILQEIENWEARRREAEEQGLDVERLTREVEELGATINQERSVVDAIRQTNRDLRQRHAHRVRLHMEGMPKTTDRVREAFEKILDSRGFKGSLLIDHDRKTLEATADPSRTSANAQRRTSTLSGGEKSFTQLSLLLSIWSILSVNLVAMDEYDVFMDEILRAESLRLLMRVVQERNCQGILITPQSLPTSLQTLDERFFEIHRLQDPDRGARR